MHYLRGVRLPTRGKSFRLSRNGTTEAEGLGWQELRDKISELRKRGVPAEKISIQQEGG